MRQLTPEDEERIINRITDEVMKRGLETVAIMFFESIKPVSRIGSQLSMVFVAPFLSVFGDLGIDYIKFFDKHENVEKLLKRIEDEIKIGNEEKQKAKEQGKLISDKFGFKLDIVPGFSLREDTAYNGSGSWLIGIMGKDSAGGFLAISFREADSSTYEVLNEISPSLGSEDVRRALMLSQDIAISPLQSKQNIRKIRGHKVSMTTYEWSDKQGQRGILEAYEMWCDKSNRLFVLSMRTGPLTGQKSELIQLEDLRFMLRSLKCH